MPLDGVTVEEPSVNYWSKETLLFTTGRVILHGAGFLRID